MLRHTTLLTLGILASIATLAAAADPVTKADLDDQAIDALIEKNRKVDFTVTLTDAQGKPITDQVSWKLERHSFEFGTAIASRMISAPDPVGAKRGIPSQADLKKYDEIVSQYFTAVVVENAMKFAMMETEDGTRRRDDTALYIARWAKKRDLYLRGHCIYWGVKKWNPDWMTTLAASKDREKIEARLRARMRHATSLLKDHITEWDLNNEMMHEDFWAKGLGIENGATYFKWAQEIAPETRFYVNEYGILQGNEINRYVKHIKELQAAGAKIGGIGDQAHFFKKVPPNEKLWEILDQMGQFGLPVKITEFDLNYEKMTEADRAEQVRRFYRVCFAHPAVEGIYMWGFWDGQHWRNNCGLWNKDWTPKPAAEAYINLITKEWTTHGQAQPTDGQITFRGFPGTYTLAIADQSLRIKLTKTQPQQTIRLD